MGLQNYVFGYTFDGVTFTDFTNVQSISLNIGVQAQLDQIQASRCTVTLRYPTGYSTPDPNVEPGVRVALRNKTVPASEFTLWEGKITDASVEYGKPYSGGVGNLDYLTVSAEGFFGDLGRMNGLGYAMVADTLGNQVSAAGTSGVSIGTLPTNDTRPMAATTVNGTWADWVARAALSTNSRMSDGRDMTTGAVRIISPFFIQTCDYNFSDTPTGSDQKYDVINFDSLANNYYTQVSVATESFGTSTVLKSGAVKPYRTYQVNTLNSSAGQATDYANYLLGNYSDPTLAISSFSATVEQQTDFKLDKLTLFSVGDYVGRQVSITFRGTTYICIIEGVSMTATPATQRFTFYVSGADLNAYLRLNSTTFGRLDFNKLGY